MTNITKEVWNIIKSDAAITKDLTRRLINTRALARYILKKYPLKASIDSVISAIRRFEHQAKIKETEKEITNMFKDSDIVTKNNVACITLNKEAEQQLQTIYKNSQHAHRIIIGTNQLKLITDQDNLKSIIKQFPNKLIDKVEHDLSELSITVSEKVIKTKGVLARIANQISLADINLEETIICPPEFLIYVKQKDVLKTYESILKLREKAY
jgi:hypothetical protein